MVASLAAFGAYFGVALVLTTLFVAIYAQTTPHKEFALMRDGNGAAALGLVGATLGFVIPLATVIRVSYDLTETAIWGAVALVVQVAGQVVARMLLPKLSSDIADGKYSAGIVQGGVGLSLGLLQAACWTP